MGSGVASFNRTMKNTVTDKATSDKKPGGGKRASCVAILGMQVQEGEAQGQGSELVACLVG